MIHQNVRIASLHISIALKCDYRKPNVPINMKISWFLEKNEPNLLLFHAVTWIFMILIYELYQMIEH